MTDQIVTDRELYLIAKAALANSYAPFSKFRVGAALLTAEDRVYSGVNVENSTYGATICAERTAIVKAVSEGSRRFKAIAVATDEGAVTPCGICRQFLFEFGDDIRVIWGTDADHLETALVAELLPRGFRL
ncbi:MAG TPA: cytidine deaminase [Clostridiales bacterium]|jgi:cytidine deaminase|nr:cytidine deaminase [Clostridiales bacterium]